MFNQTNMGNSMNSKRVFFLLLSIASLLFYPTFAANTEKDTLDFDEKFLTEPLPHPHPSDHFQKDESSNYENKIPDKDFLSTKTVTEERNIRPVTATDDQNDMVEINFDNTDIQNLLLWVSDIFAVTFLTDDAINPLPQGGKSVTGKITFKTHSPLTKKQTWDLFLTFLDVFGLSLVQGSMSNFYKVVSTDPNAPRSANRSPLPSFINVSWQELPDNEQKIRYAYYVKNSSLATIQSLVDAFRSPTSSLKSLQDLNAFILIDKSFNIRSIMQLVEELDGSSLPEVMSVLKLKYADAEDVKAFYENLTKTEDTRGLAARLLGTKKLPTSVYFPDNLRLFAERRTNTLIILGTQEGIDKIEKFIINYVDTELKTPYSPLYIYELQYTKAEDIATILTNVTKFAPESPASQSGGVRDGDKYLRPMSFQAEPSGNRLLINAEKEDYLKVLEVIKQLDVKQPQVAIEVLIVNVLSNDDRELGIQFRNKNPRNADNVNFQTSGLPLLGGVPASPLVNPTTGSLVANLIQLAQNQSPGAALLTISDMANGVWGIFKVLESLVHTDLILNPFLVTTNNYTAQVSMGETRRVLTGQVQSQLTSNTFGDISANLTVNITPLINNEGNINLTINISIDAFTSATDPTSPTKNTKTIKTIANVGNKQVLALGGLLQTNEVDQTNKVPVLGDVPIFGWLFKNKTKIKSKDNLLVFISPRIVEPKLEGGLDGYSREKAEFSKQTMKEMRCQSEKRDIIHRWFFRDYPNENVEQVDNFVNKKYQAEHHDIRESVFYKNNSSCIPEDDVTYCSFGQRNPDQVIQHPEITVKGAESTSPPDNIPDTIKEEPRAKTDLIAQEKPIIKTKRMKKQQRSLTEFVPDKMAGVAA